MLNLRRVVLGSLVGSLAVLASAVPAQATKTASAVCGVSGSAATTGGPNWKTTSIGTSIDKGEYNFNSFKVVCAGAYDNGQGSGGDDTKGQGVAVVQVNAPHDTSSGHNGSNPGGNAGFTNVECGTGTAGAADVSGGVTPLYDPHGEAAAILGSTNFGYQIVFAGGQGVLYWSAEGADPGIGTIPDPNLVPTYDTATSKYIPVGAGAISISPWVPGSTGNSAVDGDPVLGTVLPTLATTVDNNLSGGSPNQSVTSTVGNAVTQTKCTDGFTVSGVISGAISG